MKFSQIERGINNFSAASRGDQKFNRVFHPVSTTHPREPKNDNSLSRLLLNTFTRWDFMTMTDNIFYICSG